MSLDVLAVIFVLAFAYFWHTLLDLVDYKLWERKMKREARRYQP